MKPDDEFTFGEKGPKNLGDFDPLKVKRVEDEDMWETWVLTWFMHALFVCGVLVVVFLWWVTGRKDG